MLRAALLAVALLFPLSGFQGISQQPPAIPLQAPKITDAIRQASVTIQCPSSRGSGTLFHDKDGEVWALTASHVIHGENSVQVARYRIVADGKEEVTWVYAKVQRDSPDEDLALLHVGKNTVFTGATKFHVGAAPAAETPIVHCGTFAGTMHHSLVRGSIVTVGRPYPPFAFKDHIDLTAWYGSSGGGVHLENGDYIGMVTHGVPGNPRIILMTPVRRILDWAKKEQLEHVFCWRQA